MDKKWLLNEINCLAKSNSFIKYGRVEDIDQLKLLLVEIRVEQEDLNSKVKFTNEAVLGIAMITFIATILTYMHDEINFRTFDYIFGLFAFSVLGIITVLARLSIFSKRNRLKIVNLKRLEEYVILYLNN